MIVVHTTRESKQARARLVAALREQGAIQSERVAQAFLVVPREGFVTYFYEQQRQRPWDWEKRTPESYDAEGWITAVYQDKPLITLIDERNMSISSSSMPTVMAMMLEALEVQPGMSVLEIGTGSGYNAGLLAQMVGDPALVTSIDLEEDLARAAERALHEVIGPVAVQVGDGRLGVPEHAPYKRIVATASSPGIPRAWYEQLAPGGRLVMDLQGSLQKSSFLVLEKAEDGSARGRFDARPLYFMPLRSADEVPVNPASRLLRESVSGEVTVLEERMAVLLDDSFLWFLQWYAPGITLSRAKATQGSHAGQAFVTLIDGARQTLLQLYQHEGQWSGYQHGGAGLWETIELARAEWERVGCPALGAYEVVWEDKLREFQLMLRYGEFVMAFPL